MASKQPKLLMRGLKPYRAKKNEPYMGAPQRAHFKAILTAWRAELSGETSKTTAHMRDEAVNFPDPNDRASAETDMALELRERDRDRKLIKRIDESIESISTGEFGYCENCGEEIGIKRLEARPTAVLCIDCKTVDEIRERQLS